LTGGIMSSRLTAADPALETFGGGIVVADRDEGGVGSPAEARAFAIAGKAREMMGTDVGLAAVTPFPAEDCKPGTVVAAAVVKGAKVAETFVLFSDPVRMRNYSVISALDFLRKHLAGR
jgi:nicotinamide-nucleotide amidase